MPREDKVEAVERIKEKLRAASGVVLTDYRGLDVPSLARVRQRLREQGVEYKVLKNTLVRLAARGLGLEGLEPYLVGPTALALGFDDSLVPARLLVEVGREFKTLQIKAGLFDGRVLDRGKVEELAVLPSREVLLAWLIGNAQGPLARLTGSLNRPLQQLTAVLSSVARQRA